MSGGIEAALKLVPRTRMPEMIGTRMRMRCPNPEHKTRSADEGGTPSFYVHVSGTRAGQGKCYGCGITCTWSEVVKLLSLPREARFIGVDAPDELFSEEEARGMLSPRARQVAGLDDVMPWPREQRWRGVSGRLVQALGGVLVPSRRGAARLRLPVTIRGEQVGHIDCTIDKPPTGELGYVNSSGAWVQHALYPYDFVRRREPEVVVVTEGTRDPLVTIQNGIDALTTLGSTNWSPRCAQLLLRLAPKCVVIMADPDDAGDHLKSAIYRDIASHVDTRIVELPSRIVQTDKGPVKQKILDPADLRPDQLRRALKSVGVVKQESSNRWIVT